MRWLSVTRFASKYNLETQQVYMFRRLHTAEAKICFRGDNSHKSVQVNEDYFIKRREFRKRLKHNSQELYYYITLDFSDWCLSKYLNEVYPESSIQVWNMFIKHQLFYMNDEASMMDTRISLNMLKFYRAVRWYALKIYRPNLDKVLARSKGKVKRVRPLIEVVGIILDDRMNDYIVSAKQ